VLEPTLPKVAVEAGVSDYWRKYVGLDGAVLGIDRYGESAPGPKLFEYFGLTVENAVRAVKNVLH
jgi:transketolase